MDCKLVYAIIPRETGATLEDIIENKAHEKAVKLLNDVQHTMRLEGQGTTEKELRLEINRIARELKKNGDSSIWDTRIVKRKSGTK